MQVTARERLDLLVVALMFVGQCWGNEYMMTCSRPVVNKTPRLLRLDLNLPCDLSVESWCNLPGEKYPWHAVRSFVFENQGLMRRMYGEVRQLSVLRMEFNGNSIDESNSVGREFDELFKPVSPTTMTSTTSSSTTTTTTTTTTSTTTSSTESPSDNAPPLVPQFSTVTEDEPLLPAVLVDPAAPAPAVQARVKSVMSPDEENKLNETTTTTNMKKVSGSSGSPDSLTTEEGYISSDPSSSFPTTTEGPGALTEATTLFERAGSSSNDEAAAEGAEVTTEAPQPLLFQDAERATTLRSRTTTTEEEAEDSIVSAAEEAPQQIRSDIKGVNACPVKEEVVAPYWANNTRGEVLALLNLYPFEQYIHWEKCTFEHRQMYCREGCRCEQQYRLHRLLAFDPTNECRGIFSDWFRFPSCCVCKCYLTSSDLAQERFSFNRSPRFDDSDVPDVNGVDDSHFYYKSSGFNLRQPR